jgi:hypothetical protein
MCPILSFTVKELDSSDSKLPVSIHGVVCSGCSLPGCDATYFHVWAPTVHSDMPSWNSQLKWGEPHPPHFDPNDKCSIFFCDQKVSKLRTQQYELLAFYRTFNKSIKFPWEMFSLSLSLGGILCLQAIKALGTEHQWIPALVLIFSHRWQT